MEYLIVWGLWITLVISLNLKEIEEGNIDVPKAFIVFVILAVPFELLYIGLKWVINV